MIKNTVCTMALLLLLSCQSVVAQQVMEIIQLRHRLIGDVLPTLRGLVSPGGTVTGMNEQLIIRTDAENLADLKRVLGMLDRRLRQLRITVRQDINADTQFSDEQLSGRISSGNVRAKVGRPHRGPGVHVGIGDENNRIDYQNFSTRRQDSDNNAHFVTTIEGQPAFINAGQVVPQADQSVYYGPYGASVQNSVRYRDVGSGFYVTPRIVGEDGVNLEISPYAQSLDSGGGGVINSRGLSTVVNGRLGQWIALGGASQSGSSSENGIVYRTQQSGQDHYDVWVKVDLIP